MTTVILIGCLFSSRLWFSEIIKFYTVRWPQKIYSRLSCAKERIISLMECVSMCHSILERHSYLIEDWYYQWEPKGFWQIKQKAITLCIPTERKRSGTELVLVYCFVLLDDGLQAMFTLYRIGFCSVSKVAQIQREQELMFCWRNCSEAFPVWTQALSVIQFATLPFDFKGSVTSTRFRCNFCSDKVFRLDSDRFKNLSDTERFNSRAEHFCSGVETASKAAYLMWTEALSGTLSATLRFTIRYSVNIASVLVELNDI